MSGRTKEAMRIYAAQESAYHVDYTITDKKYTMFPFVDNETKEVSRSSAIVLTLTHAYKEDHQHTVVVAHKKDGYYFWCGDGFVSGKKLTSKKATEMVSSIAINGAEKLAMMKSFKTTQDKPCRFWAKKVCSHTNMAMTYIDENSSVLDRLEEMYEGGPVLVKNRTPQELLKKLKFKKHVLLQGDKGSGKTRLAESYAKEIGAEVFFLGGSEKTEASDFVGEYIPMAVKVQKRGQGKLFDDDSISQLSVIWKDGPLAQAFRCAASGKKAVFVIDEMLRVPQRELSPLISALTPTPDKTFQLGTSRAIDVVDDIAQEELLQCNMENLWIIGTTNIGAAYAVDKMDEALADRVRIVSMNTEEGTIKKVLEQVAKSSKYSNRVPDNLFNFYKLYEKRRTDGVFKKICNLRHLVEAIECSINEEDVKETIWETRHAWVSTDVDGKPRPEQVTALEKIIEKVFSA